MQDTATGFVRKATDIEELPLGDGAGIRWLITHKDGAENYSMRLITAPKGKSTPSHSHDYEHEIFVVEGSLDVTIGESRMHASKGDFIFIPPNIHHNMRAEEDFKIVCVVPIKAAKEKLGD